MNATVVFPSCYNSHDKCHIEASVVTGSDLYSCILAHKQCYNSQHKGNTRMGIIEGSIVSLFLSPQWPRRGNKYHRNHLSYSPINNATTDKTRNKHHRSFFGCSILISKLIDETHNTAIGIIEASLSVDVTTFPPLTLKRHGNTEINITEASLLAVFSSL